MSCHLYYQWSALGTCSDRIRTPRRRGSECFAIKIQLGNAGGFPPAIELIYSVHVELAPCIAVEPVGLDLATSVFKRGLWVVGRGGQHRES